MKWGEKKSHCVHAVVEKAYPYTFRCKKLQERVIGHKARWERCGRCMWREKPGDEEDVQT